MQAIRNVHTFVAAQPSPITIVPGHGAIFKASGSSSTFSALVDYLTTLQSKATEAVVAGMNLTHANVHLQMPSYSGYSLYPWVQNSINGPFAFVEAGGKIAAGETCGQVCWPPQGNGPHHSNACSFCASGQCDTTLGPDAFWVMGQCV